MWYVFVLIYVFTVMATEQRDQNDYVCDCIVSAWTVPEICSYGCCCFFFFFPQVFKERVRVLEWMKDYDKLRCGRISRVCFHRALDLCRFELAESELALLDDQSVECSLSSLWFNDFLCLLISHFLSS